jgi:Zn-dependent peptidase ImmA (M78 family)
MFNPSRLTLARLRLGLTRPKLADASDVSLRSITHFENAAREPSDESLEKLARALRVPLTFFERDDIQPVPVTTASFRKLSKVTAARRDAVLALAALTLEFFAAIEEQFRLPEPSIPTFDKLSAEQAADLVRHQWELGQRPISNMVHLLESKGVRVASLNHRYSDIDAFCFYRDAIPYVFLNTAKSAERQRFDASHELGHLVLHSDIDMERSTSKEREAEANAFASSFLMPQDAVLDQSMASASVDRILAARSFWRVSAMAMTHRLHELSLLSDWQYRSTCITLSERGYRSSEPGGIVPETSQLLRKVMYGSGARLRVGDAATALDVEPAEIREYVRHLVPLSA